MPRKTTTATPKPKMPPKFVLKGEDSDYILAKSASESNALEYAAKAVQPQRHRADYPVVGVYQLVKVVRRKTAPVEIEEISCCREN